MRAMLRRLLLAIPTAYPEAVTRRFPRPRAASCETAALWGQRSVGERQVDVGLDLAFPVQLQDPVGNVHRLDESQIPGGGLVPARQLPGLREPAGAVVLGLL